MKKNRLLYDISKSFNEAETYRDAGKISYKGLDKLLYSKSLQKLSICLMYLNDLHKDKYKKEQQSLWDYRAYFNELDDEETVKWEEEVRIRQYLTVVGCIIRHGENYHEDYI